MENAEGKNITNSVTNNKNAEIIGAIVYQEAVKTFNQNQEPVPVEADIESNESTVTSHQIAENASTEEPTVQQENENESATIDPKSEPTPQPINNEEIKTELAVTDDNEVEVELTNEQADRNQEHVPVEVEPTSNTTVDTETTESNTNEGSLTVEGDTEHNEFKLPSNESVENAAIEETVDQAENETAIEAETTESTSEPINEEEAITEETIDVKVEQASQQETDGKENAAFVSEEGAEESTKETSPVAKSSNDAVSKAELEYEKALADCDRILDGENKLSEQPKGKATLLEKHLGSNYKEEALFIFKNTIPIVRQRLSLLKSFTFLTL
jgi:hypothetical protein